MNRRNFLVRIPLAAAACVGLATCGWESPVEPAQAGRHSKWVNAVVSRGGPLGGLQTSTERYTPGEWERNGRQPSGEYRWYLAAANRRWRVGC